MFWYSITCTISGDGTYYRSDGTIIIEKVDSSVIDEISIDVQDESDTVVTEITPDEGYYKAFKLTASNGYERIVKVKVENMTQDEWDANFSDEDEED